MVGHLDQVKSEAKVIPYSIACINADNGLKESVKLKYVDKIETMSLKIAE